MKGKTEMDAYKKLKLEYNGIRSTIEKYTSGGNISNFLDGLKENMDKGDGDATMYYLNEIKKWYSDNIGKSTTNGYVFDKDSHFRNKQIIEELCDELKSDGFTESKKGEIKVTREKRLFLSHRSSDKKYGDAIEEFVTKLGVKNNELIYTSHSQHKIPLNANIFDYLRNNIDIDVYMIILWSNDYLESPACISELGAAWLAQNNYTSFYTPDFSFNNPKYNECPIDRNKMGVVLNGDATCKMNMFEFKNELVEFFNLAVEEKQSSYLIDEFIKEIKE